MSFHFRNSPFGNVINSKRFSYFKRRKIPFQSKLEL
eukprot:jgi/Galph1/2151/GphlegSOOS_G826.1